jgi:hypothetical protein
MQKKLLFACLSVCFVAALLFGCAGMQKPSEANFINPTVTLSHVEIPYYVGYYYFANSVEPTKGKAGDYGAPLMVAFIFDIENPNPYPVQLENLRFSVMFEDFEVNTVASQETMWIPAGKTNQLRVPAMFDTRQTLLTLLLPGALKLKEKGLSPWDLLEKWWVGVPDFSFEMTASQGAAIFRADGLTQVVAFEDTFP